MQVRARKVPSCFLQAEFLTFLPLESVLVSVDLMTTAGHQRTGRSRAKLRDQFAKAQHSVEHLGKFVEKKKRHIANKMLGVQHNIDGLKEKASKKANEFKQLAG
jgi:hypothetical protein